MAETAKKDDEKNSDGEDAGRATPPKGSAQAVLNNEERLRVIQLPGQAEKVSGTIRIGPKIQLLPGWNFVPREQWEIAEKNPMVQALLNSTIPSMKAPEQNQERVGEAFLVKGPRVAMDNPLGSVDEDTAVRFVRDLFVVRDMRGYLAKERRERVASALRQKIDSIDKAGAARIKQ